MSSNRAPKRVSHIIKGGDVCAHPSQLVPDSNDPEQDDFADTVTTDLTTHLARTPATFVVRRETAFGYKYKSRDLKQLGTDLGIGGPSRAR